MKMKKKNIGIIMAILSFCCCKSNQPLETVKNVDLNKYVGKWYEIAAFPQRFEKGCSCVVAEYSIIDGKNYVSVTNSCFKVAENKTEIAKGKAFIVKGSNNAKLKVQFFWPFKGKYWIIELADDYSYVVVGHPNRNYLWILSRTKEMDSLLYEAIVQRIKNKGFDITKIKKMDQSCN